MLSRQKKWVINNVPGAFHLWAKLKDPLSYRQFMFLQLAKKSISFHEKYQFANYTMHDGKIYIHTPNGCKLQYVPDYPYSALLMEMKEREFEKTELKKAIEFAESARTIIDIGANCGYYSISLALIYPDLEIHAFEPVSHAYFLLKQNCEFNKVTKNVNYYQEAVGNRVDSITITATKNTSNYVINASEITGEYPTLSIPVTTLDFFVEENNIGSVDGIKCDIEGYELFMLQGAENVIDRFHPWLLLEIDERWTRRQGYNPADVINFLMNKGYRYEVLSEEEGVWHQQNSPSKDHLLGYSFLFSYTA